MTVVHCKRESFTQYIGRPSLFGNPFLIGRDGNRDTVIRAFEQYARGSEELLAAIAALPSDAVLGCFCAPHACHGDVIVKLWHEIKGEDGDLEARG